MKILSITAQKPHSTGSGTYLTELVNSWDRNGHRQTVVCGIYPDDTVSFPDGVTCYPVFFSQLDANSPGNADLPFPVTGMSDIMPYTSTRYRDLTPEMISMFERAFIEAVGRAIRDLDPDLIVCHHLFLLTSMVKKHFPGRRIYGISHGTDLRQMLNCPQLAEMIRPHIAGLDMLLALHEKQKEQIMDIFGVSADKVRVIGSGYNNRIFNKEGRIERQDFPETDGIEAPVRICYAGKLSRPKGVPEFLKALEMLGSDPDVPGFEVSLAGGCQDDEVQKLIDSLPPHISYIGMIPQDKLAEVFRSNDIFVLPSYFEGLPLVLIEAMACGLVPVSTDLPGVRAWIESNVPNHNVRFVNMPEMAGIDQPTEKGRAVFTQNLHDLLRSLIICISSAGIDEPEPDTSGITWDSVAARIAAN